MPDSKRTVHVSESDSTRHKRSRAQGAVEAHARAETDAVFDAAAALLDAAPERARPALWRAEKDKESPTTSLSLLS